jgi:5-methyltetrahydropteroyltriglutamate--homocysteine methyltransferase
MLARLSRHEPIREANLNASVETATREVIHKQLDAGIDIGNNGEQPRESFFTYVQHRMSGFGGRGERPGFADLVAYPSYLARLFAAVVGPNYVDLLHPPKAIGEVRYINREPLEHECADYVGIASDYQPGFRESFMTAPSPGIIALAMLNDHYPTLEAYVAALADALRVEYETIVGRGLVLQIDAPDLAGERPTPLTLTGRSRIFRSSLN